MSWHLRFRDDGSCRYLAGVLDIFDAKSLRVLEKSVAKLVSVLLVPVRPRSRSILCTSSPRRFHNADTVVV